MIEIAEYRGLSYLAWLGSALLNGKDEPPDQLLWSERSPLKALFLIVNYPIGCMSACPLPKFLVSNCGSHAGHHRCLTFRRSSMCLAVLFVFLSKAFTWSRIKVKVPARVSSQSFCNDSRSLIFSISTNTLVFPWQRPALGRSSDIIRMFSLIDQDGFKGEDILHHGSMCASACAYGSTEGILHNVRASIHTTFCVLRFSKSSNGKR